MELLQPSTMSEYTEDAQERSYFNSTKLAKYRKVAEKNNSYKELVGEIRKFDNNFGKLQSDLAVTKQVNTELIKQIVTLESQWQVNYPVL